MPGTAPRRRSPRARRRAETGSARGSRLRRARRGVSSAMSVSTNPGATVATVMPCGAGRSPATGRTHSPGLARAVGRLARLTAERAAGGHVDDASRSLSADHVLHHAPGHVRGADEVDAQGLLPGRLPLGVRHLGDRVCGEDAGVVHQDVQPAQHVPGAVHHAAGIVWVGQIGLHHHVPVASQPGRHVGSEARRVPVVHRDPVTLLGERLGDGPADAPRRSGHQDRSVCHPSTLVGRLLAAPAWPASGRGQPLPDA